jgi:hypothetical protein
VLTEKEHLWQSRKPSKRALQLAFYQGRVTISARSGMLKTYELIERHFGWRYAVPAYALASYVAMSRLHENVHRRRHPARLPGEPRAPPWLGAGTQGREAMLGLVGQKITKIKK